MCGCWLFVYFKMMVFTFHPIHIAVSDLVYNEKSKSVEITHKIFIDDIENHIQGLEKAKGKAVVLRLNTPDENPKADDYLNQYLQEYFKVKLNGKFCKIYYLGKEYETDAVWIYAEIKNIKSVNKIEIEDGILMDWHSDQDNLLHMKVKEERKSLRFNGKEKVGVLSF